MTGPISSTRRTPPPPPPPPPRKEVDNAVRRPELHKNKPDVPPPERYVQHEVEKGQTLTEVAHRYQTSVPMLEAANPQLSNPNQLEVGQKVNVPIGADYGKEPTRDVLEPGQTLTDMAREYTGVSAQDIARANRSDVPNSRRVQPGQELWVPAHKEPTPLEQKVQATDEAQAALDRAQQSYDALPPNTNQAIREEVYQGVSRARTDLDNAVREELDLRAEQVVPPEGGWGSDEERYAAAGAQLKERYQADEGATQQLDTALNGLANERHQASLQSQAEALVTQARNAGDAPQQIKALNESLEAASPEVREALLQSPAYDDLLKDAADWATEPLAEGYTEKTVQVPGSYGGGNTAVAHGRVEGEQAAQRLDQLTEGLGPEQAAELLGHALPQYEAYGRGFAERHGDASAIGKEEMSAMLRVLDRGAGAPHHAAHIQRMVDMGLWNAPAAREHIAQGGSLEYVQAWGKAGETQAAAADFAIQHGMTDFRASIQADAQAYAEHMDEISWLVSNHGGTMTPEQLEKAIADYTQDKGKDWEKKGKELEAKLADKGEKLLMQMAALTPEQGDGGQLSQAHQTLLREAFDDPSAQAAMQTALQQNPKLTEGAQGEQLLSFFADPSVKGALGQTRNLHTITGAFTNAYLKNQVLGKIENFDPADRVSVAQVEKALDDLGSNTRLARVMGLTPEQTQQAARALKEAMPEAGESMDQLRARMMRLDQNLGLDRSSLPGQLFRGVGLALAGTGLLVSGKMAMDEPTIKNNLKVLADSAGLVHKSVDLLVGIGKLDANGLVGKALTHKWAGKILGGIGAAFDVWGAIEAFNKGDHVSGAAYGASAVGSLMMLVSGPVGWVGLGIVCVSSLVVMGWQHHQNVTKYETPAATKFLQASGLNENAARALTDQSGQGHSPMPLLTRYAEHKGLDLSKPGDRSRFIDWLNGLSPAQLSALASRANLSQDAIDGNVDNFAQSREDDTRWEDKKVDYYNHKEGYRTIEYNPVLSANQMDQLLDVLGAPSLG